MRKILKKVVTAVASMAMLAGMVAGMPTLDAKAGSLVCKKNIYVSVPSDTVGVGINVWQGLDTMAGNASDNVTWAKAMTKVQNGLFKITGDMYDDFTTGGGLQIIILDADGSNIGEYKTDSSQKTTYWNDVNTAMLDSDMTDVWLELDKDNDWTVKVGSEVEIVATDAEIAAAAEAKIDTALALEATKANKSAYDTAKSAYDGLTAAQKALVTSSKVTTLTSRIATIQAIIDAENAAASGTLTIYVTAEDGWETMNVYGWDGADFGAWPGKATTPCEKNDGWFSLSFNITQATNLIFNNGDGVQTDDINGVTAGTYWYVIKTAEDGSVTYEVSTTAPTGWVEEQAVVIEQVTTVPTENGEEQAPTTAPTENGEAQAPTTADTTPVAVAVVAILALGLGVVALNSKKVNR